MRLFSATNNVNTFTTVIVTTTISFLLDSGTALSPLCSFINEPFSQNYGNIPFDVPFTSMIVFGDSYSDTGNIYSASNGTAPSPSQSWDGRYSDGPVWTEYIAKYFDLPVHQLLDIEESNSDVTVTTDFAWGGATTNNNFISAYSTYIDDTIPAVNEQIQNYLGEVSQTINDDVLHVLWSGYNDYWWYVYHNYTVGDGSDEERTNDDYNLTEVASSVAQYVVDNMEELYINGARQFMVVNLHNMSAAPEALAQTDEVKKSYNILVNHHNRFLEEYIDAFESKYNDTNIYRPNVYQSMDCISTNQLSLGFYNTIDAYYEDDGSTTSDEDDGYDYNVKDAIFTYKWWDAYHPTTRTHQYLASQAIQTLFDFHTNRYQQVSSYSESVGAPGYIRGRRSQ
jgi:thermolabile hemolysin